MAAAKVTFHPGASADYAAAFSWYHARGTVLGANFEREIDRGSASLRRILYAGQNLIRKGGVLSFANLPIRLSTSGTAMT